MRRARVQGGTNGLLAAIHAGRVDPFDARIDEERELAPMSGAERRAVQRRDRRRAKRLAARLPF